MKRLSLLLMLSCCLAPHMWALEGVVNAEQGEGEAAQGTELSNELDDFVRRALNEGLLTPAGTANANAAAEQTSRVEAASAPSIIPGLRRRATTVQEAAIVDCKAGYPLDFSDLRDFDRYQQVFVFHDRVRESGSVVSDEVALDLGRAYVALGLYSEASMVLKSVAGTEADAYRKVATLMDGRLPPDIDYFRRLAACHEEAGIWLSIALLASDKDEGVQLFSDNMNGFRKLPFRLRTDITALAVPAFDKRGERILPIKLVADFSEQQVSDTLQLRFARALVDLADNRPDAEQAVRTFLSQPQYQEEALAALMRHEKPLNGVYEEILLGELMKKFGQTGNDRELAASLQFALQELSGSSHYQPVMELAVMPALQNEDAQAEIRRQLVAGLERDLASDNRLRNLAALNALVSDRGILDPVDAHEELYRSGAMLAVRFGLGALARDLVEKGGADDHVAEELAGLEFQRQEYSAVFEWARQYPDNPGIALLAAQGAIRKNNVSALAEFEPHTGRDAGTILTLIEQDAAAGYWIVSDDIYKAAAALTDGAQKQRTERVLAMRATAQRLAAPERKLTMAGVPAVLKSPGTSAGQVTGGTH